MPVSKSMPLLVLAAVAAAADDAAAGVDACKELRQADFAQGSVVIEEPGCYRLAEDISFAPNYEAGVVDREAPELCMFPDRQNPKYSSLGFSLGFFAAIVVKADDVTLDLNQKTLEQSERHALCQRFYANIDLASAPFPMSAGPADFASDAFKAANRVTIKNGRIGRSSHHGIHGNGNADVKIVDVEITDFEVGGIHLNKVKRLRVNRVQIHKTRADVPANGRLSQAQFLLQAISTRLAGLPHSDELKAKQGALRAVLHDFLSKGEDTADGLFGTATGGIPDASMVFGVLVHPKVNVGDFADGIPAHGDRADNIHLENLSIKDLHVSPGEKATLVSTGAAQAGGDAAGDRYSAGTHVHDNVGAVLDTDFAADRRNGDRYVPNPLTDLQIELGRWGRWCLADPGCAPNAAQVRVINRNTISEAVAEWSEGKVTFQQMLAQGGYRVEGNGDVMFHKMKGAIGLKLDGSSNVRVKGVEVAGVANHSNRSRRSRLAMAAGEYKYLGDAARGVSVAASTNVHGNGLRFSGIHSNIGAETCLDLINQVKKTVFRKINKKK